MEVCGNEATLLWEAELTALWPTVPSGCEDSLWRQFCYFRKNAVVQYGCFQRHFPEVLQFQLSFPKAQEGYNWRPASKLLAWKHSFRWHIGCQYRSALMPQDPVRHWSDSQGLGSLFCDKEHRSPVNPVQFRALRFLKIPFRSTAVNISAGCIV